jgi:hypothetical protein
MTTKSLPRKPTLIPRLALLCLLMARPAFAAPDVPPNPRLATPADSSSWTITYQYKNPNPYLKPPADPSEAMLYARLRNQYARIVSIQVVKSGNLKKETYQFDNQTQKIHWIEGHLLELEDPQRHTFNLWDETVPGTFKFTGDFDSLSWVKGAEYKGHQSFQGIDCCAYHAAATDNGEQTAYVDFKTGLPVGVQQGDTTILYVFSSSGEAIELPPMAQADIKRYQDIK